MSNLYLVHTIDGRDSESEKWVMADSFAEVDNHYKKWFHNLSIKRIALQASNVMDCAKKKSNA